MFEFSPIACTLLKNRWVQSMKESNMRNPGYFVFTNTSMLLKYCVGSTICSWGGSVCENEVTWISYMYATFIL